MIDNITIKLIASGSTGNAYKISDGKTSLLIECGIAFKKIQQAINFKMSELSGVLITHEHPDHCKATKDMIKAGIKCYMSAGTAKALELSSSHSINIVSALKQFKVGSWTVLPFDVIHDAAEPLGFLLVSEKNKILYLTDTAYCPYSFNELTIIMIECNYQQTVLKQNIVAGIVDYGMKERLLKTHMNLSQVVGFLKANDLKATRTIYLLHLSSRNANAEQMKKVIISKFGKPVIIARQR